MTIIYNVFDLLRCGIMSSNAQNIALAHVDKIDSYESVRENVHIPKSVAPLLHIANCKTQLMLLDCDCVASEKFYTVCNV